MQDNPSTGTETKAAPTADTNGANEQHTSAAGEEARTEAMRRAEEMVDRWGEQVGQYISAFGRNILKWAARAREEAEDIWAEAQALREQQRNRKD